MRIAAMVVIPVRARDAGRRPKSCVIEGIVQPAVGVVQHAGSLLCNDLPK